MPKKKNIEEFLNAAHKKFGDKFNYNLVEIKN